MTSGGCGQAEGGSWRGWPGGALPHLPLLVGILPTAQITLITLVRHSRLPSPASPHPPPLSRLPNAPAATKFIGGHSDVTAGILAVRDKELADRIYFVQNAEGTALGPFDCWLLVRGIKTMALRMERQVSTAQHSTAQHSTA